MLGNTRQLRIIALLLGMIFLAGQFHYCADVTSGSTGSHICPLCSTAGSVIAPAAANIAIAPVVNRLEVVAVVASVFLVLPRSTSPRAPPSL